ncbi:hypothetical protein NDU88_000826 [Pleurodeles waltl]|uniref:Uncharacterized protein n=1 Tax=Pleurodeles waltl TaxID=8319 RepID=A0AAV7UR26_PLEWA|nr:hypothetical protein NDU88_000826 [Pleurodeles waltl]
MARAKGSVWLRYLRRRSRPQHKLTQEVFTEGIALPGAGYHPCKQSHLKTEEKAWCDRRCRRWTSVVLGGSRLRKGVQDAIQQERCGCRDGCGIFDRRLGRRAVRILPRPCL